jgi:predicted dehydrogenase
MNIAILGASGVGKYHAREFDKAGCNVVAILGSSKESSEKAVKNLYKEFGIKATPYYNLYEMLESEKLDAVSICTPPKLHEHQTRKCLESNLHVFCEKPFVEGYEKAKDLFELSEKKKKILAINMQWPSIIPTLKEYTGLPNVSTFSVRAEPAEHGKEMLNSYLSHANSLLIGIKKFEEIKSLKFLEKEGEINVFFNYGNCEVKYFFRHKSERPREFIFGINDTEFTRQVGENYQQEFVYDKGSFKIKDPFTISITKFIGAINGNGTPLIKKEETLHNIAMQEKIENAYLSFSK